jgi:hypothetical protein
VSFAIELRSAVWLDISASENPDTIMSGSFCVSIVPPGYSVRISTYRISGCLNSLGRESASDEIKFTGCNCARRRSTAGGFADYFERGRLLLAKGWNRLDELQGEGRESGSAAGFKTKC